MKANQLFSNKQYGFIEGRSTALQLLEVIDKWSEALDEGLDIDCICTCISNKEVNLLLWWIKLEEIKHGCYVYKSSGEENKRGKKRTIKVCARDSTIRIV
jgi:hypothetical protein